MVSSPGTQSYETVSKKYSTKVQNNALEQKTLTKENLRDRLGKITVMYIQQIAQQHLDCLKEYKIDRTYLRRGIWYAGSFLEACRKTEEKKLLCFLKKNKHDRLLHGYAPSKFFSKISDPMYPLGIRAFHFIAKQKHPPSKTLDVALNEFFIGECGLACQVVRYATLQKALGPEKFNRLFGKKGMPMNIGYANEESQPMKYFVKFAPAAYAKTLGKENARPVKVGQLLSFHGVTEYPQKKPFGPSRGFNVICTNDAPGKQTFCGLGLPVNATEKQINQKLLERYNLAEDPLVLVPEEYKATCLKELPGIKKFETHQATEVEGYQAASPQDYNIDLIQDLIELPQDKVSMDYVINHPSNSDVVLKDMCKIS